MPNHSDRHSFLRTQHRTVWSIVNRNGYKEQRTMNVFVAAWYYPPVTSSEGIVTYKLLRKSKNNYDVFSSLSDQWSYHTQFSSFEEPNITTYTIDTDDINAWVEACVAKFEELYPQRHYECLMTRSTPPESILVGLRIKEKHPEVKWIASLADPVANNPYELKSYVTDNPLLTEREKRRFKKALMDFSSDKLGPVRKRSESGLQLMCRLHELEGKVIEKADLVICPTERQLSYLGGEGGWKDKYFAVPHSFSSDFYPQNSSKYDSEKTVFTYTGFSDSIRSLRPIVDAVLALKRSGSPAYDKILFRFVGNTPGKIKDLIYNFDLQGHIRVESPVDYFESLAIMQASDWLIHVDAYFGDLKPGGSIFFAGKIADYLGTGNPILALTGNGSPAARIVEKAGGVVVTQYDTAGLADIIEKICMGTVAGVSNKTYRDSFESAAVAERFDSRIDELCSKAIRKAVPAKDNTESASEKILSVCVPSYNVQRCLGRCLDSLVSSRYASYLDIIVVDDGSKDCTLEIAQDYEKVYPGIIRAVHKENGGHGSTINKAMELAVGKYFRVVDSDDWIDSSELDKVLSGVLSGEIDTDIVSTNYHIVRLESGESYPITQDCAVQYGKVMDFSELETGTYFTMSGIMIKTSALKRMDMRIQENTFYVDVEFILFPIPYVDSVMFVDAYIYKYSQGSAEQSISVDNMVKRYDHHERVLKRIIKYRNNTKMSEAQGRYYDSVLKRVIYTHYGLCLAHDKNKKEGYERIRQFDEYLHSADPELYKWIGRAYPLVRTARRMGFNYMLVRYSPGNIIIACKDLVKKMIRSNSRLLSLLIKNRFTYRIANSRFFTQGKGLALRNRIMKAMIK